MKLRVAALALCLVPLAACATTAPKPCSAEWIDYKKEKILHKFSAQNRPLIEDLKHLARSEGGINPISAMKLMGKADELKDFATSFNDTVLPELQAAVDQCGGQEEFVPALTEYLKGEGVSDDALQWVGPVIGVMLEMRNSALDSEHKTSL